MSAYRYGFAMTDSPNPIDPERLAAVERAREGWIRRLIDTSRRNNLLYFRDLKVGTLDLSGHSSDGMAELLVGEVITLSRLLPDSDPVKLAAQAKEIVRRAVSNLEEKGLDTLFLAFGMATWNPDDDGRPPDSAVLLLPVKVTTGGRGSRSISLERNGDPQLNLALLHVLETDFGCCLSPEEVLTAPDGEEMNLTEIYALVSAAAKDIDGFQIKPRVVLGNFSFQKMAMLKDLKDHGPELASHDMIAALAGDPTARDSVFSSRTNIDPSESDLVPPENEFLFLDADSSQQRVIASALKGHDGVIQGPPGGGKSQTIANLIVSFAAQGKRILFVAEKRAALEVVMRRLQSAGLEHLALDLHGADVSHRLVMQRLGETLTHIREVAAVSPGEVHTKFVDRRSRLNGHVERLHSARPPAGFSVYELQGKILRLEKSAHSKTRWRGSDLDQFDKANAEAICNLLIEAGGFASLLCRTDTSPWTGALLGSGEDIQSAIELAVNISSHRLPSFLASFSRLSKECGLASPNNLEEARGLIEFLGHVSASLKLYQSNVFEQAHDTLIENLRPCQRGVLSCAWARLFNPLFRAARKLLRSLRKAGPVRTRQLLEEVSVIAEQLVRWRKLSSLPSPVDANDLVGTRDLLDQLLLQLSKIEQFLPGRDLIQRPIEDLRNFFASLVSDTLTPYRLPRLIELESEIMRRGAGDILREIREAAVPSERWADLFTYAWLASTLDSTKLNDRHIAGFNGQTHQGLVTDFCHLDRQRLKLAAARVARLHAERSISVMNQFPEQTALVRREVEKRMRHLPLRKLFAQASDVLTAVSPCWMASPLSVSQLLAGDRRYFDVVLFDEASQVIPEDAIPAVLRASHVVVAGDQHQLPPTSFFADGGSDNELDDEAVPTEGFESLLDLMVSFLEPWPLEWHYRSQDEGLIAFSNRHIYGNRLITFPGPGVSPSLSHSLVQSQTFQEGQEDSSSAEVNRVVELILEHAEKRPNESLGVIAMGIKHARRVEAALDDALVFASHLEKYFDPNVSEKFFIKNLERVQGDERDAIILTIGYGKDAKGNLPYRFGPLLTAGGERRLNVAVTRARRRMTLVSSFGHLDMDPSRSKARGVELLRLYLQYASGHGLALESSGRTDIPLNPFEADVFDTLISKGIPLVPQWGESRYRIDMVAQHPKQPGRFVLAIECDGASYHSAPTARDRDRLRQQQLEALGWRFHRIWSTDWFFKREQEINRTLAAYQMAVERVDRLDSVDCLQSPPMTSDAEMVTNISDGPSINYSLSLRQDPRPKIPKYGDIGEYKTSQLISIIRWIESDGLLRTDDEMSSEVFRELGFQRRGPRIMEQIQKAIRRSHHSRS